MNWENALNKFIDNHKNESYFEGAVLAGSYASGNNNDFSDIDIHILTSNDQDWRHRGNTEIDGFLIEYFINPIKQAQYYFECDYKNNTQTMARMISSGKILIDKNGNIEKLQKTAKEYLNKKANPIKQEDLSMKLYFLWDGFDELKSLYNKKQTTSLQYNLLLNSLLDVYFANKGLYKLPASKIESILTNKDFEKRYGITSLPSKEFVSLFINALKEQTLANIETLYNFVVASCGGFDIKEFSLKTQIDMGT